MADIRQTTLVTGGASGFGAAIARTLALAGSQVVLADVNDDAGARVVREIEADGGRALFCHADCARAADWQGLIDFCLSAGGLDILVNNAGVLHPPCSVEHISEAEFDRIFSINAKSVHLSARAAVPEMRARGGGVIINVASITAMHPRPGQSIYAASKGAVVTLTRAMAVDLAPDIRVNCVAPVAAQTPMLTDVLGFDEPETRLRAIQGTIPLERLAEPDDVANAVAFLADPASRYLTGVCLPIDGGRSI